MARRTSLDAVTEQAIDWMVELRSGAVGEAQRAAFRAWLSADTRHLHAWQSLGVALDATFGLASAGKVKPSGARADAVASAIEQAAVLSARRRRVLRAALGVAGLGLGSSWVARSSGLLADWRADLHTATGERRTFTLADGSRLQLDARSSVDVRFSDGLRLVQLRQGQLRAEVAANAHVPFVVRTEHASIRALGSQFMVRQEEARTQAVALRDALEISTLLAEPAQRETLMQGQGAWIDGAQIARLAQAGLAASATAWTHGVLHAEDQRLGEVLAALKPYRLGYIRVSLAAARLRVTGIFGLDDSDAALQALAETLPIDVHRHSGGWLVRVELAA
ncbi:FecR domain-containing protein [Pantoea sp. 18069]|uniref:FecR family protein n=1 Tax=Pantoea sp. 18069 TaxID=2681415 RepID=UPI001356F968|nr:FecR domain-containing protein [Pantoea sp. 18069]